MTPKQLADTLNGRTTRREITHEEARAAKAAGLVVVFGYSDDNVELRGAINDEIGAFDGTTFYVTPNGLPRNECECDECPYFELAKKEATPIKAVWCAPGAAPWTFETAIPHATFTVMDEGEPGCIGIVFALADVGTVTP